MLYPFVSIHKNIKIIIYMQPNPSNDFVIPSQIPWDSIKGRSLEECTYWLLEAMGAKSLDWRLGGQGNGAADGGRDLECVFHVLDPSGEMISQRWWIEAKGRQGSVSPADIKESIHTTAGKSHVDIHLIVTNQQLSNPTKDWINSWQSAHTRPRVRVWERHDLERLVVRNPSVAVRMFPKALTDQGKAEVIRTRFWEYSTYADVPSLRYLWKVRSTIKWDYKLTLAVLASECANGDLSVRPWAMLTDPFKMGALFLTGLSNTLYVIFRADAAGVKHQPYIDALSHLLIHVLARFNPVEVAFLVEEFASFSEPLSKLSQEVKSAMYAPIVRSAVRKAADSCISQCGRVTILGDKPSKEAGELFWRSFRKVSVMDEDQEEKKKPTFFLEMENQTASCNVGLRLSKKKSCPFFNKSDTDDDLVKLFSSIRPAILARTQISPVNKSLRETILEHCED